MTTTITNKTAPGVVAECQEFLEHVLGGLEGSYLLFEMNPGQRRAYWYNSSTIDDMAARACDLEGNVFFGVASRRQELGPHSRGGDAECLEVQALWGDFDWQGPNHRSESLPPDLKAVQALLADFPCPPTALLNTGGGYQGFWLLKEPAPTVEMKELIRDWGYTWERLGARRHWHVDNVWDRARIMRVPGTANRKKDCDRLVVIEEAHWERRYDLSDFEPYLIGRTQTPKPALALPRAEKERPGDAYNRVHGAARAEHANRLFSEVGWEHRGMNDRGDTNWRRPGSSNCSSATVYADGHATVWSTAAELGSSVAGKAGLPLDLFGLYTMLFHGGDFKSATRDLRAKGYGDPGGEGEEASLGGPTLPPAVEGPGRRLVKVESAPERPPTDLGNAQRFIDSYGDRLRYVPLWEQWLVWNGSWWERDQCNTPKRYAREEARAIWEEAFGDSGKTGPARRAQSSAGIAAMVQLAQADPRITTKVDDLDRHPDLLVVKNGTVDLRTGLLRPSEPGDLITKGCNIEYHPTSECPNWERFLKRVLPDREVRAYLQRAFGYSLTGSVTDEKLFFCYGVGANGKSVVAEVLRLIMGEYARAVMDGYLTSSNQDAWATADLYGRRVIFANETRQDGTVNEARLKQITSYEPLIGAHKYGHPFSFVPTHKLWIRGNYHPRIVGTDEGIWRRLDLISFSVTIPQEDRNPRLIDELLVPELPGILAWAVRGAVEWYEIGLKEPTSVVHATQQYRQDEDVLGRFLSEKCQFGPRFRVGSKALTAALESWAEAEGIKPAPTSKALSTRLKQRGLLSPKPSNGQNWWQGVGFVDFDHASSSEDPEEDPF